jgi:hypothetical protein
LNLNSLASIRLVAVLLALGVVASGFTVYRVYTSSSLPGPTPIKHIPGNVETPPPLTPEEKQRALSIALQQPMVQQLLNASNGNYTILYIAPASHPSHRLVHIYLKFNRSAWLDGMFYSLVRLDNGTIVRKYVHRKMWTRAMEVLVDLNTSKVYLDTGISPPSGHHYEPELEEAMPLVKQYLKLIGAEEVRDIALLAVYYDECDKGLVIVQAKITMDNQTKYYLVAVDLCKNNIREDASGEIYTAPTQGQHQATKRDDTGIKPYHPS